MNKLVRFLWWRVTDLVAFFYRLLVGGRFDHVIRCADLDAPVRVFAVHGRLIPRWASGITLGRNIFVWADLVDHPPTLAHELTHVRQGQRLTFLFALDYLWQAITRGYKEITYEKEAYMVGAGVASGDPFPCPGPVEETGVGG